MTPCTSVTALKTSQTPGNPHRDTRFVPSGMTEAHTNPTKRAGEVSETSGSSEDTKSINTATDAAPGIQGQSLNQKNLQDAVKVVGNGLGQRIGELNQYCIWHPVTLVQFGLLAVYVGYSAYRDLPAFYASLGSWTLCVGAILISIVSLAGRASDYLTKETAESDYEKPEAIFGLDVVKFAKGELPQDAELSRKLNNTEVVLYRDRVIAAACIQPVDMEQLKKQRRLYFHDINRTRNLKFDSDFKAEAGDKNVYKTLLTGLGVVPLYLRSGIRGDLLDWAVEKTALGAKRRGVPRGSLSVVCHNFEKPLIADLKAKGFKLVREDKRRKTFASQFFNVRQQVWNKQVTAK